jgi:hypothetical protein
MREESVLLKDSVYAAFVRRKRVEASAVHPDFASGRLFETGDESKQSGFARAAFTQESEKFAGVDFE